MFGAFEGQSGVMVRYRSTALVHGIDLPGIATVSNFWRGDPHNAGDWRRYVAIKNTRESPQFLR